MRKMLVSVLAVVACSILGAPGARAADAKADGPDLKDTMKLIKRYLNEEAGKSSQKEEATPQFAFPRSEPVYAKYVFVEKPWASPEEATINYEEYPTKGKPSLVSISFKLKDLDPDKIRVETNEFNPGLYWLNLRTAGGQKLITYTWTDRKEDKDSERDSSATILFLNEETANKACRAFRQGVLLARATDTHDPLNSDVKTPIVTKGPTDAPPIKTPPDGKPTSHELQRRGLEKQIADLDAQLPAARQQDAENREYNKKRKADLEEQIKDLNDQAADLANKGQIAAAAVATGLESAARNELNAFGTFKDTGEEDRVLRRLADIKKQLIDLRD